jgi:hypothetical protein
MKIYGSHPWLSLPEVFDSCECQDTQLCVPEIDKQDTSSIIMIN